MDRRARRPEPAGDLADWQRARHAARRGARRRGDAFRTDVYPTPSITKAALVGIRSLDPGERKLIADLDVRVFTMSDIDKLGLERVVDDALGFLAGEAFLHVSLDLDAVDPMFAPGVGTPVRGGLSYREAHLALELIADAVCSTPWTSSRSTRFSIGRTRRRSSRSSSSRARSASESSDGG